MCASDSTWSPVVVKQMDLVENDNPDQLGEGSLGAPPRDDVPLFWSANNDLRLCDLLLGHLRVSRKLANLQPVRLQPLTEIAHHFLDQRFHGSNVNDFELLSPDGAKVWLITRGVQRRQINHEDTVI